MKKVWIIIVVALVALLAIYLIAGGRNGSVEPPLQDRAGGDEGGSPLGDIADYGTKVVYQTDLEADTAPFEADCDARGGSFNLCGNPCPPGAESCAAVCAYTCDGVAR